jgi:hypothetical protein
LVILISGAALLAVSPAVLAQEAASPQEQAAARRELTDFAACAAARQPEIATRYVLSDERLPDAEWEKLIHPRCMPPGGGALKMNPFYFRGALAQELLEDAAAPAVASFTGVAPLVFAEDQTQEQSVLQAYMLRLGECIDRRDPAAARAVFATRVDSPEERAALQTVAPSIAACVPAGEQVRMDRINLRTGMATSYYRLANASPAPGAQM